MVSLAQRQGWTRQRRLLRAPVAGLLAVAVARTRPEGGPVVSMIRSTSSVSIRRPNRPPIHVQAWASAHKTSGVPHTIATPTAMLVVADGTVRSKGEDARAGPSGNHAH